MKYEFHPDALVELEQAAHYYGAREAGLDVRFMDSPESFRGCLTHVFPHGILYTIEQDHILILAVMHCSREPGYWRYRLRETAD
jgi:hypothetical protein